MPSRSPVVLLIAAAQVDTVRTSGPVPGLVLPVFLAYLAWAALIAQDHAAGTGLPHQECRALAFSLGARNSFAVFPFARALPAGWETTVVVIVFQSLVKLLGMLLYLGVLPRYLFPAAGQRGHPKA